MDIKEYISSGILESYVLGGTSPEESLQVEEMMARYPLVRDEVSAIQKSLEGYADSFAKEPPAQLKDQIWSKIQEESAGGISANTKEAKIRSINEVSTYSSTSRWMVAASVILLAITTILNIVLYNKWKSAEQRLTQLNSEKEMLAQQFQVQQAAYTSTQQQLAIISQPNTKIVTLKGVAKFPEALATIFWNTESKQVFLKVNNLPPSPAGKQYQLWAIVDGTPQDAGVFDPSTDLLKMKDFSSAQAFAVTLENAGGSPTPTMDAMYVVGSI